MGFHCIGNLFGAGKSSVCTIVKKICEVLAGILPWYISFCKISQKNKIRSTFLEIMRGFLK